MRKWIWTIAVVVLAASTMVIGFRVTRDSIAAQVYRKRLQTLATEYETLRTRYNDAVRRSAVTELIVKKGKLSVRVRSALGVIEQVDTPYDPSGEIYVDYAVVDGRLWIRRVFDAKTPPSQGMVIDPKLAQIDWSDASVAHGKAIYRSLDEGRWVVTVTGGGSLGLTRLPDSEPAPLVQAPPVQDYKSIEKELDKRVESITVADVWRRLIGDE